MFGEKRDAGIHEPNLRCGQFILDFCLLLTVALCFATGSLYSAQTASRAQTTKSAAHQPADNYEQLSPQAMETTRTTFNELLDRFPRLARVVARDPSLLSNEEYVRGNAPELWQFIQSHPQVARDPEYFLEGRLRLVGYEENRQGDSTFLRVYSDVGAFLIFVIMVIAILWILRVVMENRRWNRLAKIQTEAHTKLLEKFGSSQELLAYMATEPGKRFLEAAAPIPTELGPQPRFSAPIGRILWSAQAGLILALSGFGMLYIRHSVPDAEQAVLVLGTLGLTFGLGFVLSAIVSYALSKQLGLLERPAGLSPASLELGQAADSGRP